MNIIYIYRAIKTRLCSFVANHYIGNKGHKVLFSTSPTIDNGKSISIGNNTYFGSNARLSCWGAGTIQVGSNCHFGDRIFLTSSKSIVIGDNFLSGNNVLISDNYHGDTTKEHMMFPPIDRPLHVKGVIKIGHNVWVGQNVCILSGVSIGDNAVIGANSVVTHDVPAFSVVAGVPARVIKNL